MMEWIIDGLIAAVVIAVLVAAAIADYREKKDGGQ